MVRRGGKLAGSRGPEPKEPSAARLGRKLPASSAGSSGGNGLLRGLSPYACSETRSDGSGPT
jgi:hypothetical protein